MKSSGSVVVMMLFVMGSAAILCAEDSEAELRRLRAENKLLKNEVKRLRGEVAGLKKRILKEPLFRLPDAWRNKDPKHSAELRGAIEQQQSTVKRQARGAAAELSEAKRKRIYRELGEAHDRATGEANRRYPVPHPGQPGYSLARWKDLHEKNRKLDRELSERYELDIATSHGISQKEADKIYAEGVDNMWPPLP